MIFFAQRRSSLVGYVVSVSSFLTPVVQKISAYITQKVIGRAL